MLPCLLHTRGALKEQRGLASKGYRPGPLMVDPSGGVNSEHSLVALQIWWHEAMGRPQPDRPFA